jgi:hypothetical protein
MRQHIVEHVRVTFRCDPWTQLLDEGAMGQHFGFLGQDLDVVWHGNFSINVQSLKYLYLMESGLRKMQPACAIHRVTQSHPVNKPRIPLFRKPLSVRYNAWKQILFSRYNSIPDICTPFETVQASFLLFKAKVNPLRENLFL